MIKALILAYDFPPYTSVGGQRPYNWYKHFKDSGIFPIVITRQWSNRHGNSLDYISEGDSDSEIIENTEYGIIIKTPYRPNLANRLYLKYGESKNVLPRKIITAFYEFSEWFFIIGPKSELYRGAKKYLAANKVDVIIASGEPYILFRYACLLGKKFKTRWIADYRDAWIQDKTRFKNKIHNRYFSYMERKFVSSAFQITTVSDFIKKQLVANLQSAKISVFTNGFDEDSVQSILPKIRNNNILTISFAGTIYLWHPWKIFLSTVNDFIKGTGEKITINFFGINIREEIDSFKNVELPAIKDCIYFFPRLSNKELLQALSGSDLLLLFNDYSISGTKIYDYLAVKKKIILCFADDEKSNLLKEEYYCIDEFDSFSRKLQEDIIKKTNSGIIVKDSMHLKDVLPQLYFEFEKDGKIDCNSSGIDDYSRKKQTESMAKMIKQLVETDK